MLSVKPTDVRYFFSAVSNLDKDIYSWKVRRRIECSFRALSESLSIPRIDTYEHKYGWYTTNVRNKFEKFREARWNNIVSIVLYYTDVERGQTRRKKKTKTRKISTTNLMYCINFDTQK